MEEKNKSFQFRRLDAVLLMLILALLIGLTFQQRELSVQNAQLQTLLQAAGTSSAAGQNTAAASSAGTEEPFTEIVAGIRGSVVGITIYKSITIHSSGSTFQDREGTDTQEDMKAGTASGVVVGTEQVLTCWHVVQGVDRIMVSLPAASDGTTSEAREATVLSYDEVKDLALISVPGLTAGPVTVGDSSLLREGDQLICIANPASDKLSASVTTGVVSGLNRTMLSANVADQYVKLFQTDAAINGGSSGGGIFNRKGELVGIVSRKYITTASSETQLEGIGMCIPINEAAGLLSQ